MADTITNLQEKSKGVEPSKAPKVNPIAAALPDFNKQVDQERLFNTAALVKAIDEQSQLDMDAQTMAKCTKSCFMSMQESALLPSEKRCFRNCFVKTIEFNRLFADELSFQLRNMEKKAPNVYNYA